MNRILTYPAVFNYEDGGYWAEFIDLEGCFTQGNTLQEVMNNAREAMGLYLEDLKEYPKCTENIKDIKLEENQFISFITIDMDEYLKKYSNKSIKKTLSIPAWLNTLAEKENLNFSQILQEALKNRLKIDNYQK